MNLHIYFDNFLENGLTNLEMILNLVGKQNCITFDDLQNIGINKPGHAFRILARMEYDSGIINENLSFLINRGKFNDMMRGSMYFPKSQISCCAANKTGTNKSLYAFDLSISDWLAKIGFEHLKKNFSHNGFDSMDYLLLQMFSSYQFDNSFLENHLHIYQLKDRKLLLTEMEKMASVLKNYLRRASGENFVELEDENNSQADCKICLIY